jgi:serine protease Do
MNGKKVEKLQAFRNRVANTPPNSKIELKIFRDGKYIEVSAITKEMEPSDGEVAASADAIAEKLGIAVENMDSETARRLGYEDLDGVIITEVEQGGAAWNAGLKPGKVITSVNRQSVHNVRDFETAIKNVDGSRVLLLVTDGLVSRFIVVNLDD